MKILLKVLKYIGIFIGLPILLLVILFGFVVLVTCAENSRGNIISTENNMILRGNEELARDIYYQGVSGENIRIDRKFKAGFNRETITEYIPISDNTATYYWWDTKVILNNIRFNNDDSSITVDLIRKYGKYAHSKE